MKYYEDIKIKGGFDETIAKVKNALGEEGFGVLSEIRIDEKFKKKLDIDFRKYMILGACNPEYAFKALIQEDKLGLMLPCNVIIQEISKQLMEVAVVDPVVSMIGIDNNGVIEIAKQIKIKLENVITNINK